MQKCVLNKKKKERDSRMFVSRQFDYSKTSKNTFSVKEHLNKLENLGVIIGFGVSSLING